MAKALGLCVQVISAMPLFEDMVPQQWQAPWLAVSVGNAVLFWVFVQALFDDDFALRPVHVVAWLAAPRRQKCPPTTRLCHPKRPTPCPRPTPPKNTWRRPCSRGVARHRCCVGRDARFGPLLSLDQVGVYGMSAGGHTALSMAGGRWSAAGFKQHCEANMVDDFRVCVGLITRLTGGLFDGIKKWAALSIIRHRFADTTMLSHEDPRIAAVVAGVPSAADFDMASLATPRVPLGLVSDMLNDPHGFDRSQMHSVNQKIAAFFVRHLVH
nr:hypothetical protein [Rhodoferax sp.]